MATSGTVTRRRIKFDCKHLMVSTCKITKAGIGGPLIDFDGNFIGMNFYDMEQTPYLPGDIILKLLRQFDAKGAVAGEVIDHPNPNRWPVPEPRWYYPSSVFYVHHPRRMLQ
uniref:Uncharacterized protein n=1 Tax=Arundo donax TaxID=35708 RepID=A0A0A9G639_ARUDO